jgi:hypothetical protein
MRLLPVPTIIVLIGASAAAHAVEVAPAGRKLAISPASVVADTPVGTPVSVSGIGVTPAGNLGSADGKMKMHLKGLLGGGYDSNLYATDKDAVDDVYVHVLAGIEAVYRVDDRLGFGADVIVDNQSFSQNDDRDLLGGSARVRGAYKGDTMAGNVTLDYILVDDPLVQTGQRIQRESYGANTVWLREMLNGGILVNADIHRQEYLEDQDGFVAEDRNVNSLIAGVRYIGQANERSSYWARVGFASDAYDTNNRLQDNTALSAAIGADLGWGDRATVFAEIGVDSRSYSDDFANGYDDKSIVAPIANIGLYYPVNDKGTVATLRAYTEARNSLSANAMQVTGISLDGRHPVSDKATVVASIGGLLLADYGSQDDVSERQAVNGSLGAEYTLRDGIVLRATGRYTQSVAELDTEEDYNRFEGVLETAFVF